MSGTWFTSDLHLGHVRVAAIRGFDSTDDHDRTVIANWLETVRDRDIVYVLGDLTCDRRKRDYALHVIDSLPGTKHLIAGNHDDVASIHRTGWKHLPDYLEVFASVRDFGRLRMRKQDVLMSHYPYDGDRPGDNRYGEYRLPDHGVPLLHGHTHLDYQRLHLSAFDTRQVHVGLDAWDLRPVPLATVEQLLLEDL